MIENLVKRRSIILNLRISLRKKKGTRIFSLAVIIKNLLVILQKEIIFKSIDKIAIF